MLDLVATADEGTLVGHLGPDLLGPDWDLSTALTNLRRDPQRAIGEALLDQRLLAGIGTLYDSESLFLQRIHPWTPVGELDDSRPRATWSSALTGCCRSTPAARCRAPPAACDPARRPTSMPGRGGRAGAAAPASGSR